MTQQIFLSYSHADTKFATVLVGSLEGAGYEVWFDRTDIKTGTHWDDEIVKGLDASAFFLVLLSKSSVASQNVKDEIGYAVDHNKHIVPLLLEACDVPFRLRRVQYVDFTSGQYEEGIRSMLAILQPARAESPSLEKKERKPVDPITLATTVTSLVAPYLAKMGGALMEEAGAKLPESVGKLWNAISGRFKDNPAASGAANDLAKKADDTDNQEAFALQLKKALKEDADFAETLAELFEEAKSARGIRNVGDGAVATNHSVAVGKIQIDGDLSGNITIGNNNQIK